MLDQVERQESHSEDLKPESLTHEKALCFSSVGRLWMAVFLELNQLPHLMENAYELNL